MFKFIPMNSHYFHGLSKSMAFDGDGASYLNHQQKRERVP